MVENIVISPTDIVLMEEQQQHRDHLANAIAFLREAAEALCQAEAELRDIQRQEDCPDYGARFLFPNSERAGVVRHLMTTDEALTVVGGLVAFFEERIAEP